MNLDIALYYKEKVIELVKSLKNKYANSKNFLMQNYESSNSKKLCKNEDAIKRIKELLDSVKEIEKKLKSLLGSRKEETKDETFYGEFVSLYDKISEIDSLYNKVRNYITKKPYSNKKIKLNFDNPQLLDGWDKNKEKDYRTVILKKDNNFYLAIMNKGHNKLFENISCDSNSPCYEKMDYKLLPGPNKMLPKVFFSKSNIDFYKPNEEITRIYKNETFKKGDKFNIKDCHKLIDFYKNSISIHHDWSQFNFEFLPTKNYKDISEFYSDVEKQGYSIKFQNVSENYINNLVDNGQLFLFQIYNKDFSSYSKGNPNLHTLYFRMLFDAENIKNVVYQLNGGAEMFYREASILDDEKIIHIAKQPIKNKNVDNKKTESIFDYDIVKDKRYTCRQFSLHLPITLNFKADKTKNFNEDVRKTIKDTENNCVIGIDRGERNLLYICVVNEKGEIKEQKSLNEICNVNYHKLLDNKEDERDNARKNWDTIQNIKELKEGYLSQVINEICNLIIKYDAIVAMENLNYGFKNSRVKVEKQVYQKFENMLISKLNYLVKKNIDKEKNGGLLNAYQLTNKVENVKNNVTQNGFIIYVNPWLTSKIDPITGFFDLLRFKYTSVNDSKEMIKKINNILYNSADDLFEIEIDFSKFKECPGRKVWTICSYGERIFNFRDKDKNNSWNNKTIVLTDEFKLLFDNFNIDYKKDNIKEEILNQNEKTFFERFIKLLSLTMQLRNSEIGNIDVDYIISPIKDSNGNFYDSRYIKCNNMPNNADANGAYNIARKALFAIQRIKEANDDELKELNLLIKNNDWIKFIQNE